MADPPSELHETIAAKGQLEKAIARMVVEETTAAMAKSLGSFLDRLEAAETGRRGEYEAIVKGAISEQLAPLMAEFRTTAETVSGLALDVERLKATVAAHDREMASFRASRDASIEERRDLFAKLDESSADRAKLHQENDEWRGEARTRFDKQEELIRLVMEHLGLNDDAGAE